MQVTFQQEPWEAIEPEVLEIAARHWEEIAVHKDEIKLDIDVELFRQMDRTGILHITTARTVGLIDESPPYGSRNPRFYPPRLVGYYLMVVRTHPNYRKTLFGFIQSYFLLPEFRDPFTGLELFEAMEEDMKRAGAQALISGHKLHFDVGPLFKRLGWTPFEMMYTKYIG